MDHDRYAAERSLRQLLQKMRNPLHIHRT